jgi:hypothetical protein
VRHVAEVLVEVQRIPDHELVRDLEGHVVGRVAVALECKILQIRRFHRVQFYQFDLWNKGMLT